MTQKSRNCNFLDGVLRDTKSGLIEIIVVEVNGFVSHITSPFVIAYVMKKDIK